MRLTTLLPLCLAVAMASACADHATDAERTRAASWCATAARVVRGHRAASLPLPYARRTLTIASGQLADLERSFADRHDAVDRDRVAGAAIVVIRARQALERRDEALLASLSNDLDRRAAALAPPR